MYAPEYSSEEECEEDRLQLPTGVTMLELSGKELDTLGIYLRDFDDNVIDLTGSIREDVQMFGTVSASPSFIGFAELSKQNVSDQQVKPDSFFNRRVETAGNARQSSSYYGKEITMRDGSNSLR